MQAKLDLMRAERAENDRGFTLIELLVVVVIIGVLVAIAVPVYLNYRKGAENKSAMSDVRGAISAVEQYYTENSNTYPGTVGTAQTSGVGTSLTFTGTVQEVVTVSAGNTVSVMNKGTYYYVCGQNSDGAVIYVYNSNNGGSVGKSTQTTLALCATNGN